MKPLISFLKPKMIISIQNQTGVADTIIMHSNTISITTMLVPILFIRKSILMMRDVLLIRLH